jgi:LPXTG-motif cell wall-anchored protein
MRMTRWSRVLAAASCGAGLLAVMAGPAGATQQDPPGNNGTVKIDGEAFDDHPNNEPHVGCVFQVDFYGFDEGEDLNATVLFEAWPPTGDREDLLTDEVAIGEDAAGGGTDLDASATYDLTDALAAFTPHPQQGWHVKLTVHADGSQGADTKHKVFWVSGCGAGTTTSSSSSTTSSSTTSSVPGGSTTTTPGGSTTSSMPGGTTPTTGPEGTTPGVSPSAPTTMPAGQEGELPRTGSNTVPLVVGALALVALGLGGVLGARHLRGAARH